MTAWTRSVCLPCHRLAFAVSSLINVKLRSLLLTVGLLALTALVVSGAILPHTHRGNGIFNQEHDLTLLAAAGAAPLSDTSTPLLFVAVVNALTLAPVTAPESTPLRYADLRAPPAR